MSNRKQRYIAPKGNKFANAAKGKPKKNTVIKRKIQEIATWDAVEEVIEKNIMELLQSKSEKIRIEATKAFTEYVKPKKRENLHELKGNIVLELHGLTKDDF